MPFALIIVGLVLLISSLQGNQDTLFSLLKGDFIGQNNFIYWALSILVIGALGYVPNLRPLSRAFMVLVIVALFLKNGTGFFAQFQSAIGSTATVANSAPIDNGTALTNSNVGSVLSTQSATATTGLTTSLPSLTQVL